MVWTQRLLKKAQVPLDEPAQLGDRYLLLGGLIGTLCGVAVYLLSQVWPSF